MQLERFHLVKRLQGAGLFAAAIRRATGIGRKFVLTWIRLRELPFRNRMAPRAGMPGRQAHTSSTSPPSLPGTH